jgi:WD40 repeat protein
MRSSTFALCALLWVAVSSAFGQEPRIIRQPIAVFVAEKGDGPGKSIFRVSASSDGQLVAVARIDGSVSVHSPGKEFALFTTPPADDRRLSPFCAPQFSAQGDWLAYASGGGRVEIVAARTGKPRTTIKLPDARVEGIDALAFSPDGKTLAISSGVLYHKDLRVFDAATGKLLGQPLSNVDGVAWQLAFSPDGQRMIANHWNTLYLIDVPALKLAAKIPSKTFTVFFKDGGTFAIDEDSSAIREVTAEGIRKTPAGTFLEKSEPLVAMRSALGGEPPVVAVPAGNAVSVRNLQGKELYRVHGDESPIRKLGLSADGRTLIVDRHPTRAEVFRLESNDRGARRR